MEASTILTTVAGIVTLIYLYVKWMFSYWKRNGFPFVEPSILGEPSQYIMNSYKTLKKNGAKFGGMYIFFHPILLIVDLELLKNVMQKNFRHFVNRDVYCNEKAEPLMAHLFSLKDQAWKNIRTQMNPVFSAGKNFIRLLIWKSGSTHRDKNIYVYVFLLGLQ